MEHLPRHPIPDEVLEPFRFAFCETMRKQAMIEAVPLADCPDYPFPDEAVRSWMHFGECSGGLLFLCPEGLARVMLGETIGAAPGSFDEFEVREGISELLNIVAGQAKALLAGTPCHFRLSLPRSLAPREEVPREVLDLPSVCLPFDCGCDVGALRLFLSVPSSGRLLPGGSFAPRTGG